MAENKQDLREKAISIDEDLYKSAQEAKQFAYCPYSKFRVGAALRGVSGKIYKGCNIENASYPLSTCAERTALVKAVSEGETEFIAVAVTSDVQEGFTTPCGSCRQTLAEHGLKLQVHLLNSKNESQRMFLSDLLPLAFTPKDLDKSRS